MNTPQPATPSPGAARARAVIGLCLLFAVTSAGVALSQISLPDPHLSTFDSLIGASPKNTVVAEGYRYRFGGILRDMGGKPIQNFPYSQMQLDFTACTRPSTRPADRIPADGDTDVNGYVYWEYRLEFGGSDPCAILVRVQNVLFATILAHQGLPDPAIDGGLRSVDANGNGTIALEDLSSFQQEFVNTGTRVDYAGDLAQPFDGLTDLRDLAWFQTHFTAQ